MSLRLFEGPAGSGKTTHLFEALAAILETRSLGDHERVLALTKMHGSRRRVPLQSRQRISKQHLTSDLGHTGQPVAPFLTLQPSCMLPKKELY